MITKRDVRNWFYDNEQLTVCIGADGSITTQYMGSEYRIAMFGDFSLCGDRLELQCRALLECFHRRRARTLGLARMTHSEVRNYYQAQLQQAGEKGTVKITTMREIMVTAHGQDPEFKGYLHEHYIDAQSNVHLIK